MGFESPAMLWGLPAVLIPLIIHFYLRGRAPTVALDALMHLVLAGGATAMRLRLIHVILLAIRVVVVATIVLLFARPYSEEPAVVGSVEPVSFALVIDDSLSMRLATSGTTPWEQVRAQALRVLADLPPESEVVVVAASRPHQAWPATGGTWSAERAARHVSRMVATRSGTDLAGAVWLALDRVRSAGPRDRRVWVASDFRSAGLDGFPGGDERAGVIVTAFDAGADLFARNRAVVLAVASPEGPLPSSRVRVRVELRNDADDPFSDVLSVRVGMAGIARKVECAPRRTCPFEFVIEAEEAARFGEVRIAPDDLPEDDVRWFSLSRRGRNAVLLVNGEPRRQPEDDETFFLERALAIRTVNEPGLASVRVTPADLSPVHLSSVDVVVLANVDALRLDQFRALAEFATRGGGVLITAGDAFDSARAAAWDSLLPAAPRDRIAAGPAGSRVVVSEDGPLPPALVSGPGSLADARVRWFSLLDDGWGVDSRILAWTDTGAPLLVERRLGTGGVLAWLTTIDRDWTDLPLRPGYAPFVRWMVAHLQSMAGTGGRPAILVGQPRRIELPAGAARAEIHTPSGDRVRMTATGDFLGTGVPGVYRASFLASGDDAAVVGSDLFLVNVDPAESALARPDSMPIEPLVAAKDSGTAPTRRVPWHPWLLGLALSLFLAEAWLRGKA